MLFRSSLIGSETSSESDTHNLTISGIEDIDNVTAQVMIKQDSEHHATIDGTEYPFYDIGIVFTSGTGVDACKLNLTLSGKCGGETKTSSSDSWYYGYKTTTTTTTTINYTWDGATIMYGDETKEEGS